VTDAQQSLQTFALAVLKQWHNGGERGDLDGAWLQEVAEEAGVCVETERVTPCAVNCPCCDFQGHGLQVQCMPIRDDVFALMQAERAHHTNRGRTRCRLDGK